MIDLRLGDCRTLLPTIPSGSVDAVVTSPPYNLGAAPNAANRNNARRGDQGSGHRWEWGGYASFADALPEEEYQAEQVAILTELYRVCVDGASVFYVHKDRTWKGRSISPRTWLEKVPFLIRQQITWDRGGSIEHSGWYFYSTNEWVFWLTKGDKVRNLAGLAEWGTVWRIPPTAGTGHPAAFPLALAERCVRAATMEGETVLDPYAGSGTTLMACMKAGRNGIGFEIDPDYLALAQARLDGPPTPLFDGIADLPVADETPLFSGATS
jgi:site-specific DNA-methyltransferase (adenine-specific)